MYSKSIQNLIESLSKLPSIGPRQASRIVFYLLKKPDDEIKSFSENLLSLKQNVKLCPECFLSYEADGAKKGCDICLSHKRLKTKICVLQKEVEINNIENTGIFDGVYHIIGEDINMLNDEKQTETSIKKLIERIKNLKNQNQNDIEVILATNPTTEGTAMLMYLNQKLKPLDIKITVLGRGLSSGNELEYADQETINNAFLGRN